MASTLEIGFSTQKLHFAIEYRELCATNESLPHGKYYGSHDLHTLPHYQFRGLLSSFWIVAQLGL
jgi:hypothetical protein